MSIAKKEGPCYLCRSLPFSKVLKSQCSLKWEVSMFLDDKALKGQPYLNQHPPEPGKRHEWRSSPRRPPLSATVRPFQNIYRRSFLNFPESRRTLAGHMLYLYSTDSVCISSQSVCGLHSTSCLLHMPLVYYLVYLTRCALVDTFEK
jgi:hypothetical protein